jgi:NTE family protein
MTGPPKKAGNPVLVLSGGAARGAAHLGFLAAMGEAGIVPKAIVGTSAGALVGGLYASWDCTIGTPRDRLFALRYSSLLRPAFSRKGIFSSKHLEGLLRSSLGKETFEDLPVPLMAVVTNLAARRLEILSSGDLPSALAASCALPPLFAPFVRGGIPYIDGGVLSIVPVLAARTVFPDDTIIAVNVNGSSPDGPSSKGKSSSGGDNLVAISLRFLLLSIARACRIESSFADHLVLVPGGDFPLFGLRSIERIYELGYTEGKAFFGRRELEGKAKEGDRTLFPGVASTIQ